jgi:RNA polymerase sigma-70 factor (ECF subfamily)
LTTPAAGATAAEPLAVWRAALADEAAFERWYRSVVPRVYSFLLARCGHDVELAEELTQRTFVAAIESRWRFDGRSDPVTWLCAIGRHRLADHFRAREREERRRLRVDVAELQVAGEAPRLEAIDEREAVARAFRSLPAAQQAVLAFVVFDDLPVAEAGRLLGKSTGATSSLLHRAREGFRQAYEREGAR